MITKKDLNPKIEAIVLNLYQNNGMMTAHEISKLTGVSYVVVQKYLGVLIKKAIVFLVIEKHKIKKKYKGRSETKRYILNPLLKLEKII